MSGRFIGGLEANGLILCAGRMPGLCPCPSAGKHGDFFGGRRNWLAYLVVLGCVAPRIERCTAHRERRDLPRRARHQPPHGLVSTTGRGILPCTRRRRLRQRRPVQGGTAKRMARGTTAAARFRRPWPASVERAGHGCAEPRKRLPREGSCSTNRVRAGRALVYRAVYRR